MIRIIVLFACMAAISGCQKAQDSFSFDSSQSGKNSKVTLLSHDGGNEANFRSVSDNSHVTISEGTLPKELPRYIKVYKGAKNISALVADAQSNQNKDIMINFETESSPENITEFYKDSLKNNGFEIDKSASFDDSYITTFVNEKTNEALQITSVKNKNPPLTNVQLIFGKR